MKCKIFRWAKEETINKWLSENNVEIFKILQSESMASDAEFYDHAFDITIFYKELQDGRG